MYDNASFFIGAKIMGGQHGIGKKSTDSEIPPFLPSGASHRYTNNKDRCTVYYPVTLLQAALDVMQWNVKANGISIILDSAIVFNGNEVILAGLLFEQWTHPVTVSYTGLDPNAKSISGILCAAFEDMPAPQS